MSKVKRKRKPRVAPRYAAGDRVRVKHGVTDADYPDMPIGGWAGSISEVQKSGMCMVVWSQETLDAIHPVFRQRCEKDGVELERYWLGQDDLEPDGGGPLDIEQPEEISAEPLSHKDQDDRIRVVFGLDSNDPLPEADEEMLEIYQEYLADSLSFPFEAEHTPESGHLFRHSRIVKVIGLDDADDEPMIDDMHGILCEARHQRRVLVVPLSELEVEKGKPNRQLVKDYCYWFGNYR
jgi:hypothetical protein